MKENYEKPLIKVEEYVIDTPIATGCETTVSLGPGDNYYDTETGETILETACQEYDQGTFDTALNFYEGSCSCYYSSGGSTLMSS